jgi:hypothetical protein
MDIDMAREVVLAAFRSGSELERLLRPLKEQCTPDEYRAYARAVAAAVDAIGVQLIKRVTIAYPELHSEIETSIASRGRFT